MENSIWTTIPGFEKYEINELLQVRHKIYKKIKYCHTHNGYFRLDLRFNNNKKCNRYLHQLVGRAFIPNPENKPELHHIDGNKLNNHPSNLMWVTIKEHKKISRLNEQFSFKISRADVVYIRNNYSEENKNKLALRFGVRPSTIYQIAIHAARKDIKDGIVHKPIGVRVNKIINIVTGEIIPSVEKLSELIGVSKINIYRQLNGERYCSIPYRYVGKEGLVKLKPIKPIKKNLVAKFNKNGEYIETIDLLQNKDNIFNLRVGIFLNGNSSSVDGFFYKKVDSNGSFIEPTKFKPAPKKVRNGVVPDAKLVIKYDLNGNELNRYKSILYVAKELNMDKKSVRNAIRRSPRNYYKGYIWKYA